MILLPSLLPISCLHYPAQVENKTSKPLMQSLPLPKVGEAIPSLCQEGIQMDRPITVSVLMSSKGLMHS